MLQPQNKFRDIACVFVNQLAKVLGTDGNPLSGKCFVVPSYFWHPMISVLPLLYDYQLGCDVQTTVMPFEKNNCWDYITHADASIQSKYRICSKSLIVNGNNCCSAKSFSVLNRLRFNRVPKNLNEFFNNHVSGELNVLQLAPQVRQNYHIYVRRFGVFLACNSDIVADGSVNVMLLHLIPSVDFDDWKLCDNLLCPLKHHYKTKVCSTIVPFHSLSASESVSDSSAPVMNTKRII